MHASLGRQVQIKHQGRSQDLEKGGADIARRARGNFFG